MRHGGGVLILARKELMATQVNVLHSNDNSVYFDITGCCVKSDNATLAIILVYRSPSSCPPDDKRLLESLEHCATSFTNILILGDFNAPSVNWQVPASHESNTFDSRLKVVSENLFLFQMVLEPTRFRKSQNPSLLDLVFSSYPDSISEIQIAPPFGKSDHSVLLFSTIHTTTTESASELKFNYSRTDLNKLLFEARGLNWSNLQDVISVEERWRKFKDNILQLTDLCVPRFRRKERLSTPWVGRKARRAINTRNVAWYQYKQSGNNDDFLRYCRMRNKACYVIRSGKMTYEYRLAFKAKTDPKLVFAHIRRNKHLRQEINALQTPNGGTTSDKPEMAGLLSSFYSTIFSEDSGKALSVFPKRCNTMSVSPIAESVVAEKLRSLNAHKGAGPDGIHPSIVRHLCDIVAQPLTTLFNQSLSTGTVPSDWRKSVICPIFKKGNKELVENYRPVCLTSVISKTMEAIIKDMICTHLQALDLVSNSQHGFVPKRSCLSNLLVAENTITKLMDEGSSVDIVFIDFSKAFDRVNHRMLLHKLFAYGLHANMLNWIQSFLQDRSFRVKIGEQQSESADSPSGVPQGTILGPILFLLYINDLPNVLSGDVLLFADDVKIIAPRSQWSDLQGSVIAAEKWSSDWDMKINFEKSFVLSIGDSSNTPLLVSENPSTPPLSVSSKARDLGIVIDSSFCPSSQCIAAANKARRCLFLIKRSFEYITPKLFIPLYCALVRPHLEYAVQSWSPYLQRDIDILEGVQRLATRMIRNFSAIEYPDRLARLNLYSLSRRRLRGDLITVHKIFIGEINIEPSNFFTMAIFASTRGHPLKLFKPSVSTRRRAMCFSQRIITHWNKLPSQVISAENSHKFKRLLDFNWAITFPNFP
jgi:hypothetical protein